MKHLKTAVITGGANGIGWCICDKFLKHGINTAVIDIDGISGNRLKEQYGEEQFYYYNGDISDKNTIEIFVENVIQKFGKISFLINNACISKKGILSACSYEDFMTVMKIGVAAPYYISKLLLPHFTKNASIINISSTRAYMSQPDTESYSAAKGGISSLTHALSISLSGKVRVNSVSPGWIDTGAYQHDENYTPGDSAEDRLQHPSGRIGIPDDIAEMVMYLCSEKAGFINGENIIIDGGISRQMVYHNDNGWKFKNV